MADLGYRTFDSDNHYYEAPDCFSRHIEVRYQEKAITASQRADGEWEVKVANRPEHEQRQIMRDNAATLFNVA